MKSFFDTNDIPLLRIEIFALAMLQLFQETNADLLLMRNEISQVIAIHYILNRQTIVSKSFPISMR